MKKSFAVILCLVCSLSFFACTAKKEKPSETTAQQTTADKGYVYNDKGETVALAEVKTDEASVYTTSPEFSKEMASAVEADKTVPKSEAKEQIMLGLGELKNKDSSTGLNIASLRLTGTMHDAGLTDPNEGTANFRPGEGIVFHIKTEKVPDGAKLYCVKHSDSVKAAYAEGEYIFTYSLSNGTFPEKGNAGNFTVNIPADASNGYYDLVFASSGKIAAVCTIQINNPKN